MPMARNLTQINPVCQQFESFLLLRSSLHETADRPKQSLSLGAGSGRNM